MKQAAATVIWQQQQQQQHSTINPLNEEAGEAWEGGAAFPFDRRGKTVSSERGTGCDRPGRDMAFRSGNAFLWCLRHEGRRSLCWGIDFGVKLGAAAAAATTGTGGGASTHRVDQQQQQ